MIIVRLINNLVAHGCRTGIIVIMGVLHMVQLRAYSVLAPENISLEPPRQHLGELILGVRTGGHSEDVIQLFQGPLLRLWQEEEDQDQCQDIESGIEPKRALSSEPLEHVRESQGEHASPEVVRRDSPGHADFAVRQREDLC